MNEAPEPMFTAPDWIWNPWLWIIAVIIQIAFPFIIVLWARKDYKKPPPTFREQQRRIYSRRK